MPFTAEEYRQVQELRARVGKLERTVAFLLSKLEIEYVDNPSADVDPEIFSLIKAGKSLDAIRLYRQQTGADLLTAKNYIESLGG